MLRKSFIISFVVFSVLFAFQAKAQLQNGDIVLGISPRYPKPNEEVRASVSTFTIDLNNANITWMLNGETILEGIGKKEFSFNSGASGTSTILEAKIETMNGGVVNKKTIISPSDIDLLWQAFDTYSPPFYKGRTLASGEGAVKVVAVPNTEGLAGFTYKWTQDYKNKADSSGYQKNYFIYKNSYLDEKNEIGVTIFDLLGKGIGSGKVLITYTNPKIVFYQKDPNMGIKWENSIKDGFFVSGNGETIVAEPYYFSGKDINSENYKFSWYLNNQDTLLPDQKNMLAVKPLNNNSGKTTVKVIIKNLKSLFQSMEKSISVTF